MSEATRLLGAAVGDRRAAAELLPLVYDELRALAAARMAAEKPGHTLDPTGLVHEAYLRLVGDQQFTGRAHFFAAAAEAMRRVLVESARRRTAEKREGRRTRADLDLDRLPGHGADPDRWIALDDALTAFRIEDPSAAELAQLRLCLGLSVEESASVLGVSRATAFRNWTYARAWLSAALSEPADERPGSA